MQFLLIARDGPDALKRRMSAREAHLQLGNEMKAVGKLRYAAAILNENGEMNGSVMIFEMESRQELDEYLQTEPYVINNVWGDVEIQECRVGHSFQR